MGSLFRSTDMARLRLYFDRAAAHATIGGLGRLGVVQFRDLNAGQSGFARAFAGDVARCEEMARRLRYLVAQVDATPGLAVPDSDDGLDEEGGDWWDDDGGGGGSGGGDGARGGLSLSMDDLNTHLVSLERQLQDAAAHEEALATQKVSLVEARYVLEMGSSFFRGAPMLDAFDEEDDGWAGGRRAASTSRTSGNGGWADGGGVVGARPFRSSSASRGGDDVELSALEAGAFAEPPAGGLGSRSSSTLSGSAGLSSGPAAPASLLSFFSGVLPRDRRAPFERVLFRGTRGNCLARFADVPSPMEDPSTGAAVEKVVYMVFFSGAEVRAKASKIIAAFGAAAYAFPESADERVAAYTETRGRLRDLELVLATAAGARRELLAGVAPRLGAWAERVRQEKATYHTLNALNFDTSSKLFIADVWCPTDRVEGVRTALAAARAASAAQAPSVVEVRPFGAATPPTHFRLNRFTAVFHHLIEAYAVAAYHEVNPAPFAVVLFPFLFAVMFGDVGHGAVMALFATFIILREKRMVRRQLNEFMQTCYDGRYMLLLMGLFSIYTGFIYNEAFAVPLNLFGSRWQYTNASAMACGLDNCEVPGDVRPPLAPYPLGFDPVWKSSQSGLVYFNSYKMKLAIVLGVSQMILGICLSYVNGHFFRDRVDVLFVFVPQLLFMSSLFGYLVLLILIKWATNWESPACLADPHCVPPDLKNVLINLFMAPGKVSATGQLYKGQAAVQTALLAVAVISVPWMLLPKPLLMRREAARKAAYAPLGDEESALDRDGGAQPPAANGGSSANGGSPVGVMANGAGAGAKASPSGGGGGLLDDGGGGAGGHGAAVFDFSEVFVGQMIHTIEFVLGAVSNTASYLRLWALSLAHAELSDVFLEKLMFGSMASGSIVLCIIGFFSWVALTLGVLMFMESLSAFLHALRLMWVEVRVTRVSVLDTGACVRADGMPLARPQWDPACISTMVLSLTPALWMYVVVLCSLHCRCHPPCFLVHSSCPSSTRSTTVQTRSSSSPSRLPRCVKRKPKRPPHECGRHTSHTLFLSFSGVVACRKWRWMAARPRAPPVEGSARPCIAGGLPWQRWRGCPTSAAGVPAFCVEPAPRLTAVGPAPRAPPAKRPRRLRLDPYWSRAAVVLGTAERLVVTAAPYPHAPREAVHGRLPAMGVPPHCATRCKLE